MSWTQLTDFFKDTSEFFSLIFSIIYKMTVAMHNATVQLDSVNFTDTIMANYLGYVKYVTGDLIYIALITGAQIALGITLWKLLLRGVGLVKNLLPW